MINNLVLFKSQISDDSCETLNFYLDLYKKNLLNNYAIFTDNISINLPNQIPVFHTFYIRHNFYKKFILTTASDFDIIYNIGNHHSDCITHDKLIDKDKFIKYLQEITNDKL